MLRISYFTLVTREFELFRVRNSCLFFEKLPELKDLVGKGIRFSTRSCSTERRRDGQQTSCRLISSLDSGSRFTKMLSTKREPNEVRGYLRPWKWTTPVYKTPNYGSFWTRTSGPERLLASVLILKNYEDVRPGEIKKYFGLKKIAQKVIIN